MKQNPIGLILFGIISCLPVSGAVVILYGIWIHDPWVFVLGPCLFIAYFLTLVSFHMFKLLFYGEVKKGFVKIVKTR